MNQYSDLARDLLAEALKVDGSDISDETAIGQHDRWDSLAHMNLILAIETHFGKPLATETMLAIDNFENLCSVLAQLEKEVDNHG